MLTQHSSGASPAAVRHIRAGVSSPAAFSRIAASAFGGSCANTGAGDFLTALCGRSDEELGGRFRCNLGWGNLMRSVILVALTAAALGVGAATAGSSDGSSENTCRAAVVHYTPYPGGAPGLGNIPWVRANSRGLGLVALLWYWPSEWRAQQIDRALIFPGGKAPGGWTTKIMWAFLSDKAKRTFSGGNLIVRGQRLDGAGKTWQRFVPIGYTGQNRAPSYASIISLPSAGCWRLQIGAGGLHANVVFEATASP